MITDNSKILIIYTGGTIGMIVDPKTNTLKPFDFNHFSSQIPEINRFNFKIDSISFDTPIDSSDVTPKIWNNIGDIIFENYQDYQNKNWSQNINYSKKTCGPFSFWGYKFHNVVYKRYVSSLLNF